MQDKYVGDIGDYGKLTLLRQLAKSGLPLGVVWCAVDGSDEKNNDGAIRSYRNYYGKHCLNICDPELFEKFGCFDDVHQRKIDNLHTFLPGAIFFNDLLSTTSREQWHKCALQKTRLAALIFFDPDNGIGSRNSHKHISLEELKCYWNRGQSLLIYHHLSRKKGGHVQEIAGLERALQNVCNKGKIIPIHFRRGTSRVYYLVIQPEHLAAIQMSIEKKPWEALTVSKKEWAQRSIEGLALQ